LPDCVHLRFKYSFQRPVFEQCYIKAFFLKMHKKHLNVHPILLCLFRTSFQSAGQKHGTCRLKQPLFSFERS
jgi:hypothetical protein